MSFLLSCRPIIRNRGLMKIARGTSALFLTFVESVLVKMAAAEQSLLYNKQFYIQHVMDAEDTLRSNFDDYWGLVLSNTINQ